MEATVRISSDSVLSEGARGRARLAGYFYNDRRGSGSGLDYNGHEGDVWAQVTLDLRSDGSLFSYAYIGPDTADGLDSIEEYLSEGFSTNAQLDTDYVMSLELTDDNLFILSFNGESITYQASGPRYPLSGEPYIGLTSRIYAGGTGGTLRLEWDDVFVLAP